MALLEFKNLNKYGNVRTRLIYNPTTQLSIKNPSIFGSYIGVKVFKYTYHHPIYPPSLFKTIKGELFITPTWQKVHPQTELNDIIWKKPKKKTSNKTEKRIIEFKSSSSDKVYHVTIIDNKDIKCSCPGFYRSGGNCKHIKEVRESLTK